MSANEHRTVVRSELIVKSIEALSKNMIRIMFSVVDRDKFIVNPNWIGPHLKLFFPSDERQTITFPEVTEDNKVIWPEGVRERVRTYSLRAYSAQQQILTVDFVKHQSGVATLWAQQAKVGDKIGVLGMGSKCQFTQQTLVLLGDISALPAIAYTLEHLPNDTRAVAIIEVLSEADKQAIHCAQSNEVKWIVRAPTQPSQLISTIATLNLTQPSDLLFWGGMESDLAQQVRHYLKDHYENLSRDNLQIVSYWRQGFTEGSFSHKE